MSLKNNKEEQEFYKKLGLFIKIMQSKSRLDNVINNYPKDNSIKELLSDEMLCNYKKGLSRISFYKLLKLSELYGYNPHQFITEFVKYMKTTRGLSVNCIAQTKVEGEEIKNQAQPIKFDDFADNIESLYLEYKTKRENKGLKFDDFSTWINNGVYKI